MTMLTAVLIDDEKNALEVLDMQLAHFCKEVTVVEKCNSGEQGIAAIRKHQPDLVFVDIEIRIKLQFVFEINTGRICRQ